MNAFPARDNVSLCMIVRNEEKTLARAIESARPWVSEMVVVDTGSTDGTVALAQSLGAKVIQIEWPEDFAAARNVSLEAATRPWALVLDADETFEVSDPVELGRAVSQDVIDGISLRYLDLTDTGEISQAMAFRLFRRDKPGMRYRGALHEQVAAVADGQVHTTALACALLRHEGHTTEQMNAKGKVERNLKLARKLVEERPDDPFSWYALGLSMMRFDAAEMIQVNEKALALVEAKGTKAKAELYVLHLYNNLLISYVKANAIDKAKALLERAVVMYPNSPDMRFFRGHYRLEDQNFAGAAEDFAACLTPEAAKCMAIFQPAMAGYAARTQLAIAWQHLGKSVEAEALLRQAITEAPAGYVQPHRALGLLLFQRGAWAEALPLLDTFLRAEPAQADVRFNTGWCLHKLERYAEAERVLQLIADRPDVLHLLGKIALDSGKGEQALALLTKCALPAAGLARGWAFYLNGHMPEAAACWDEWLRAGAADWGTKDTLGMFLFLMQGGSRPSGQPERPAEPLQEMDHWFRLLLLYRRFDEVEQALARGPQLGDRLWRPLRKRWGITLAKESFFDVGLHLLLECREAEPEDAEIYYWLGHCALGKQHLDDAKVLWETCLSLAPQHAQATQALRTLQSGPAKKQGPTVSACLIVKNEEVNLPRCLTSLKGWVDEIVVVDTGSTDQTVAIAKSFGAKVSHFTWCDDFSAARNASLAMATSDWVLVIDADEVLMVEDPTIWQQALNVQQLACFLVPQRNLDNQGGEHNNMVARLFRRHEAIRYEGRLHESVDASVLRLGMQAITVPEIVLWHDGYTRASVDGKEKWQRNFRIALAEVEDDPSDPDGWYNLARSSGYMGQDAETMAAYSMVEQTMGDPLSFGEVRVCNFVLSYQQVLARNGRTQDALNLLTKGLSWIAGYPEFHYERGLLRAAQGDVQGARSDFEACLQPLQRAYLSEMRPGVTDELPKQALAGLAARA